MGNDYMYEQEQEVLLDWASRIQIPEGFTMEGPEEDKRERYAYDVLKGIPPNQRFVLKIFSPEIEIKIDFCLKPPEKRTNYEGKETHKAFELSGHTRFLTVNGWFTFDLRGISDSFYGRDDDDPNDLISKEIEKCRKEIEKAKNEVKVPGFPISAYVTEEERKEISEKLKAGKTHLFRPGGMGTAYEVYMGHKRCRWDVRLKPEVAEFFGLPTLCASPLDWD